MKVYKDPELISASPQPKAYSLKITILWPPFPPKKRVTAQWFPGSSVVLHLPSLPHSDWEEQLEGTSPINVSRDQWTRSPRRDRSRDSFTLAYLLILWFKWEPVTSSRDCSNEGWTEASRDTPELESGQVVF